MTQHQKRIAFLFGGLSTEHASSVEMFLFLREELRHHPLMFALPEFYYLDLNGYVRCFNSADEFQLNESFSAVGGSVVSRSELIVQLSQCDIFVFSLLQGREGEDGVLQGVFEFCNLPSNIGSVASAHLSIDKWVCALSAHAVIGNFIKQIDSVLLSSSFNSKDLDAVIQYFRGRDFIVKPNRQGASVLFAESSKLADGDIEKFAKGAIKLGDQLLVQERIRGLEVTCGCLKEAGEWRSLGCMAIESLSGFMGRMEKSGNAPYTLRAMQANDDLTSRIEHISLLLANHFDFHTQCRLDFIVSENSEIYLLEINSKPGLLRSSIFIAMLYNSGISLTDLIKISMDNEYERISAFTDFKSNLKEIVATNGHLQH